jgi:anti-sigma factor RsiW
MAMNDCFTDRQCDDEAARLLPWYVTVRLNAQDAQRVTRHLERCAICREDVSRERALRALLKSDSALEYAPQPGLAKMLARIGELEREAPRAAPSAVSRTPVRARRLRAVHWLAAAALVQTFALGALGTWSLHHSAQLKQEPRYATMSSAAVPVAPGSRIRVVFSPSMSLGALQALLAQHALTLVRGPSDAGAYTLAFTDSRLAAERLNPTVAALRRDARVMFAEPAVLDEGGGW